MKNSSEWDTEANYGVAAEMMPATAECVVHWRCAKCGRRYRARVCDHEAATQAEGKELPGAEAGKAGEACKVGADHEATAGACPYCSGKLKYVKDSLEAERPDLADEFAEATNAKDLTLEATGELTAEGVRVNDARSFWWKCKVCGYMWKATIQERIARNEGCFECATLVSHTSFPQLIIYHYLREMFPDAVHRMRLDGNREIDVCVPSIHLSVEYDGDYYHVTKASCRKDLQKNKLMADSRMDKGTTFSVYLPAKFISRETEGESKMLSEKKVFPADEPEEHQEYDSSKPSILVIDDNADIRNYISQLYAGNFFVLEAENGEDGIRKAIQYVPDIIILDVMMPGMSGMECCKVLKGELQTCHIPIIMLTAWAMDEKRIESYRLGADSFIAKPFKSELLTARIDNLLENRARMQSDVVEERADAGNGMVEMDRKFIDKLKRYIIDNMSNPNLDIDSLSEQMALSRTQLYRKVKMLTNYSPNEYIRFLRLRKAMQFLSTSSLNINEICYETGFSSPSYFSKCYKEQFGELPSDYKKRIK